MDGAQPGGSYCTACGKKHSGTCAASAKKPPPKVTPPKTEAEAKKANQEFKNNRWGRK